MTFNLICKNKKIIYQSSFLACCHIILTDNKFVVQIDTFTEELIRTGSAGSLSMLINRLDPILRKFANLGWYDQNCEATSENHRNLLLSCIHFFVSFGMIMFHFA